MKVAPECEACRNTGIVIEVVSDSKDATPISDSAERVGSLRLFGGHGPPLRIVLCPCVVERLNRALYLDLEADG